MEYLGLIPILLFVLMVIQDLMHLDKLSQLVKDFEEINLDEEMTHSYCLSETSLRHEYREEEPVSDEKTSIASELKCNRDSTRPSVIIAIASPDFLW